MGVFPDKLTLSLYDAIMVVKEPFPIQVNQKSKINELSKQLFGKLLVLKIDFEGLLI
jgi:hypothetical protein